MKLKKNFTDRKLLRTIYDMYFGEFRVFENDLSSRSNKIYVPIDCHKIAKKMNVDSELVFGRLYYHLDKKYRYKQADGSNVHFFAFKVGSDTKAIHFPLLSAVLSDVEQSEAKFRWPFWVSIIALVVATLSFFK